ncbi:MAG: hypothetical protein ACI8TQ_002325 [Planctomycetota bacterium]|jgi:hypothetical protein
MGSLATVSSTELLNSMFMDEPLVPQPKQLMKLLLAKATAVLLGICAALGVVLAGFVLSEIWDAYSHRMKFDASLWRMEGQDERFDTSDAKAGVDSEGERQSVDEDDFMWPPRLRMIEDLLSRNLLGGLNESEVIELLGPPAEKSFPLGASECDLHYWLGPERGFIRIDSEWLFIAFSETGEVNRTWLYRD